MHYPDKLSWVNVQKPADIKDAKTAKIIRSHAQREVRRRERQTKPKTLTKRSQNSGALRQDVASGEPNNQVVPDDEDAKRCEELSILPEVAEISQGEFALALSSSNPFTKAPSPQSLCFHQIYRYMSIWHGEQASRVCGGRPDDKWKIWIPTITTEEAILYAQAFYVTLSFQIWSRQSNSPDALALKDQALALKHQTILHINHNLNNSTIAVSDANLASVVTLALATHIEDLGIDNYKTHMNGLRKIIALKGGWEEVRSSLRPSMLGDVLATCDYVGAIIFKTKLLYVPADVRPVQEPPRRSPSISQTSPLLSPGESYQLSEGSSLLQNLSQLLTEMQTLTSLFETHHGDASLHDTGITTALTPANESFYSDYCQETSINYQMYQSLYLAGLIYTRALSRDIPFGHPTNLSNMLLLRETLEPTLLVGWRDLPGALLWVLLVGTAAEREGGEGNALAVNLSSTCNCIGFRHWDTVREILQRFMAIEKKVDERASRASGD
ncbi:hypothetical protein OEA41_005715 [Lepraria neglecta]|uniref:Uncharacterized protein n=1 Tax=Lepraria neglecta TaxID=209136 RepID=A0AAD9Z6A5_9LECA|nr:hypothetical protein OEA41_005715 [Lepraria neglecta]